MSKKSSSFEGSKIRRASCAERLVAAFPFIGSSWLKSLCRVVAAMQASEFGIIDDNALADVTNKSGGYGPAKPPTPHPHSVPSPYGSAPSKDGQELPKAPVPPMTELPKIGLAPMDVDEKDVAKLLVLMNENFSQMNERFNNLPPKTDFDSYMGKVNKLEGTLNVHIEAAKVDSASIHEEIKALQDRVTTIESNKGSAAAPRRPTCQTASRYDPDPADVARCEKELKLVFSGDLQLLRTPSSRSPQPSRVSVRTSLIGSHGRSGMKQMSS